VRTKSTFVTRFEHALKVRASDATPVLQQDESPDVVRRRILRTLLTAYGASLIPLALSQPAGDADRGAFVAVSAILVGRQALDSVQAARLYAALSSDDANFATAIRALLAFITERKINLNELQRVLDAERPALALLPRKIVTAWYVGVVGEDERARCVSLEYALNASVVADVLKPPTYCYGPYGSWARKPT
jgi:hypothetical protein